MQTIPEPGEGTPAMARGGSGSSAQTGGAATFRVAEGATMTLPDGCTATVRQGALELSDGQRLPLPEAGGSVTIERRVVRPDGRPALVRHTIRVGEPAETLPAEKKPAEATEQVDKTPTEVPVQANQRREEVSILGDKEPVELLVPTDKEPGVEPVVRESATVPLLTDEPVEVLVPAEKTPSEALVETAAKVTEESPQESPAEEPARTADKPSVEAPVEAPDESHSNVLNETSAEVENKEATKLAAELPAKVQEEVEIPAETKVPAEKLDVKEGESLDQIAAKAHDEEPVKLSAALSTNVQEEILAEVTKERPPDVQSEVPAETTVAVPGKLVQVLAEPAASSSPEIGLEEPGDVSTMRPTETASEVNAEKQVGTMDTVTDHELTQQSADMLAVDVNISKEAANEDKSTIFSDSSGTPLLSSTLEESDRSSSALQSLASAPEAEGSGENLQSIHIPSHEPLSPPGHESFSSPSSAMTVSLSPVSEDEEPSFENVSVQLQAAGGPYCEWTEKESEICDKLKDSAAVEAAQDASGSKETRGIVEEGEEDEDPEPVVKSRLVHHDSLRLPIHVPRLRKRSDGDINPTNTHSPCDRKAAAYLKDPQKKQQEDETMRTSLNSILHKLGYGVPDKASDNVKVHTAKDPNGTAAVGPSQSEHHNQVEVEGPEEPEPVSVTKVISFFESITPQRMESPVEGRKWRSGSRSPSALGSPRSVRSPQPSLEPGQSLNKQSASPRRVNFAESAQRVFISSTSEPDEMEDIPIPRPEDTRLSNPDLVQICVKQTEPVITSQPARLTTILVQNSFNKAVEDSKGAEETSEASEEDQDSLQKTESSEEPQADLFSNILETGGTLLEASTVSPDREELSEPGPGEPETGTKIQTSTDQTEEQEDIPDSSETTPLITSSAATELNPVPPAEDSTGLNVTPIKAEPLPRPSSVILQGDLPLDDFPTSGAVDPTDLPDGAGPLPLTGNGAQEETARSGPSDPFLADEPVQQYSTAAKRSTWFEDCLEICCCCWMP